MTGSIWVRGAKVRLTPKRALGVGGEAEVYKLGRGEALKVWKRPDHPDLEGQPTEQEAARRRLELMQHKIRDLPPATALPERVVAPTALATDRTGDRVLGYVMPLVGGVELAQLSVLAYRTGGVDGESVRRTLIDLGATVEALHRAGLVIGDFNDLNVLVEAEAAHLIDIDSSQFGPYLCTVFTERFLDPLLTDGASGRPTLDRRYEPSSDWYAFTVMVMRSLLYVGPYGGVYRPEPGAPKVPPSRRPLERITLFHPRVRYPKPAAPLESLPDDLLAHLHDTFVADRRGPFPLGLLEALRLERCAGCGLEHGRACCPRCTTSAPAPTLGPKQVQGEVTATTLFETRGVILAAAVTARGQLLWLAHEGDEYRREDGSLVVRGPLHRQLRFGLLARATLIARSGALVRLDQGAVRPQPPMASVDVHGGEPVFGADGGGALWVEGDRLMSQGPYGPEPLGEVLGGQTRLWVGPEFALGFYRAGGLSVAFVASRRGRRFDDGLRLPPLRGKLRAADCQLTAERAWLFTEEELAGRTRRRCLVINAHGRIEASIEGDETLRWLEVHRGKCAVDQSLFVATDDGLERLDLVKGRVVEAHSYPDTEPFIDSACRLLPHRDGLAVITDRTIRTLRIAPGRRTP